MHFEQLGPYTIGRKLGRGGMGTVYEGLDPSTGQRAAIKVLSAAMSRDEGFRDRFEAEIDTLRKLCHPNIVRLLGFGEQDGILFYAMEMVDGTSLEDELQNHRRFHWWEVSQIGIRVSRALKHAHDHGVIHRDIKPANLLITKTGDTKLSDFGIAKLFGATGLTADGGVLGTAEYMAPEQADGRPVTHRSDLYSLGGVLYALLAGRPPFRAKNIPEMLQLQRFAEPEDIRRLSRETPGELADIVMQLLAKDPDKRGTSAMILARRLEAMEHGLLAQRGKEDRQQAQTMPDSRLGQPPSGGEHDYQLSPVDHLGVTRRDSDAQQQDSLSIDVRLPSDQDETQFTRSPGEDSDLPVAPLPVKTSTSRFTSIADEAPQQPGYRETLSALVSPQTWALVAGLVAMGLLAWYMMQEPDPGRLYQQIVALASDDREEKLVEAEDEIESFLRYHSDDPRSGEIQDYRDEIERMRLERQLERRAQRLVHTEGFSAIERAYAEAMQQAKLNPRQGVEQLEALLALYDDPDQHPAEQVPAKADSRAIVLRLARSQLEHFRSLAKIYAEDDRQLLDERLKLADRLAATEPARARGIWQAVVQLYDGKPWAQPAVDEARAKLSLKTAASDTDIHENTE
jgi:serine/threonine-protein kinase